MIAYEVLQGHVSVLFEKDEHFYKFETLQSLVCKKYIVKRTFKDLILVTMIHSSLQIPRRGNDEEETTHTTTKCIKDE
jgi:hypothetical protein